VSKGARRKRPRLILVGRILIALGIVVAASVAIAALAWQPLPPILGLPLVGGVVLVLAGVAVFAYGGGETGEAPILFP
jgi:hypothetical protein